MIGYVYQRSKAYLEWGFSIVKYEQGENSGVMFNLENMYECVISIHNGVFRAKFRSGGKTFISKGEFVTKLDMIEKFMMLVTGKYDSVEHNFIHGTFNNMEFNITSYEAIMKFMELL